MKLIDAEKLEEAYCKTMCAGGCSGKEKDKCKFLKLINDQPAIKCFIRWRGRKHEGEV